jgi:hypothetical protein
MRRRPTFSRSRRRARGSHLVRLVVGLLGALLLLGVAARILDRGPAERRPGEVDQIAFGGSSRAIGIPERPDDDTRDAVADDIRDVLNGWYQQAFVDPSAYGDGTFPLVAERFAGDAAIGFVEDRAALTIGALASQVADVRIDGALANLTIYFEEDAASWATAAVEFDARAHLTDADTEVVVAQRVTLVLEHRAESGWVITNYYDAFQRQRSRPRGATPNPSRTPS